MKLSISQLIEVVRKEFIVSLRQRAAIASMLMFTLTTLASISLAVQGAALEPELLSALMWVIIFFAASSIDQTFNDEAITMLKVYGNGQVILFGKMIYSLMSLAVMAIFLIPLFIILFDCEVNDPLILIIISLGLIGIASAGTLIAAISSLASVKSGLFPILLFPIILPSFMPAISLTSKAFVGAETSISLIIEMAIFDAILIVTVSILFDSLWYD